MIGGFPQDPHIFDASIRDNLRLARPGTDDDLAAAAPAVLILDEPTAHLGPETRAALTADLLTLTVGRTTLLITHELEGLGLVDEIALGHGKVAQRGAHEQLMRAGGPYRQLQEWCEHSPTLKASFGETARNAPRLQVSLIFALTVDSA